jgi:DNA-binding PadR family transcriptional regulator
MRPHESAGEDDLRHEEPNEAPTGTINKRVATDSGHVAHSALRESLSAFQRDILFVLARDGPQYGLAVKSALETLYGYDETHDEVNHGRLYPNLDTLVDAGLVTKGALDERTNEYELTERGQRFVRETAQLWLGATDDSFQTEAEQGVAKARGGE